MIDKQMKNEKGFTLIEMLIAMFIGVFLLGSAIYTYTKQDRLLREETRNLQTRDCARLAMDQVTDDLLLIGFGFPPGDSAAGRPARGITVADATTITYLANIGDITTYASADSTSTNNTGLVVADPTGFTIDDNVVFYDAAKPGNWNMKTYDSLVFIPPGALMGWGSGSSAWNNYTFLPVDDNVAVLVSQYHTITYTYNSGPQTITVADDMGTDDGGGDDTTTTVANKVSSLTFTYFDADGNALTTLPLSAADRGEVRKIGISIIAVNDDDTDVTATLISNITLRNLGT